MKRFVFSIVAVLFAMIANAQTISYEELEGKAYVKVEMKSESKEQENVRILMNQSSAKKFLKHFKSSMEEASKLAATAKKKGVKSYKKTLKGSYSYSKLLFDNKDGVNVADYNQNNYLVPYFNVDSEGKSHLLLGGYYAGYNNSNMGSNYDKRSKFFFFVKLPIDELDKWGENFDVAINDIKSAQKEIDENERLMADSRDLSNQINSKESSKMPSFLSIITTPPYGIIILVVVIALVAFLVYKKKKN